MSRMLRDLDASAAEHREAADRVGDEADSRVVEARRVLEHIGVVVGVIAERAALEAAA